MLLLVGVVSSSLYAGYQFYQDYSRYRQLMVQQAIQLSDTLSKTLASDVYYKNYFDIWSVMQGIYKSNMMDDNKQQQGLIIIKEISVVDVKGRLLSHTNQNKYKINTRYTYPLIKNKNIGGDFSRLTWVENESTLIVFSAIFQDINTVGYMLISYDMQPLQLLKKNTLKAYLITQVIIFIVILMVSRYFAKKISQPLNSIIEVIPDIGSGHLNVDGFNYRKDEFRMLADALKNADDKISESHRVVLRQQQKFTGILENSNAIIYMKDIEGRYLLINNMYEKIFNIKPDDIIGKTDFDVFSYDKASRLSENDSQVLKNNAPLHFEEAVELADGTHTYIAVKFPINDIEGNVYAIAGISTDITERKKIEEELIMHKEKLESIVEERTLELYETLKEMEAFSYSVSHDLRSPLRSINGFSQALQEDYSEDLADNAKDYINRIVRATDRMGDIIDDMLLLSRVNRHDLQKTEVNLSQLAEKVFQQLQSQQPDYYVEINIEEGITASVDAKLMYIALENILGNAWKYTSKVEQACIEFGQLEMADKGTVFYVKDNGAGFDMAYADNLFKAFQRLHGAEYEGTGIGLATVYRIIKRHNGEIWAESEVGKGSTFYFTVG